MGLANHENPTMPIQIVRDSDRLFCTDCGCTFYAALLRRNCEFGDGCFRCGGELEFDYEVEDDPD